MKVIIEAVPGGVVHVALDGSIVEANAEALRFLGFRFDDLTERYISAFETETLKEDGSPCPVEDYPVAQVLVTGKPSGPMTIGVRRPDGDTYWAVFRAVPARDAGGALTGAIVTFIDITERRRFEEALRRSEAAWRSLAENLPDTVLIVGRDERIRSINRLITRTPEEVIGARASDFIDAAYREEWQRHFQTVLATGVPVRFETRSPYVDGRVVWWETRLVPIQEGGEVERVVVVGGDMTERRAMIAQLAEKERLASAGMLSASVAHEIMNPLTSVLASLDFAMSDRCPPGARQMKALLDAREGAARMQQIVRDLRTLGRAGSAEFFYVDVREVLETAIRLAGPDFASNIRVHVELGEVPDVLASESRLCQVFINLLTNAAHALAERPVDEREIRVRTRTDEAANMVAIEFHDTGVGIASENLERIFDPFFTTKQTGTGLGLSISKESLERMGGRIEVQSRLGEGTTFTVWLSTTRVPSSG